MTVSMVKERESGSAARVSLVKRRGSVVLAVRLHMNAGDARRSVDVVLLDDRRVMVGVRFRATHPARLWNRTRLDFSDALTELRGLNQRNGMLREVEPLV